MEGSTSKCKDGQIKLLEHEHPLELVDLQPKLQLNEEADDDDDDLDTIPEFRGQCEDGQIMVLEHEHPLELVDLQQKLQHNEEADDDDDNDDLDTIPEFRGQCGRCSQVISEYHMYYYKCVDTCGYSLHKFCAALPPKLEHTSHVHPLIISKLEYLEWTCDVCKIRHKLEEILYHCHDCYFCLDVNCVLGVEETKIYHPSHPHQLVSTFSKPILCRCDACGEEHKGIFYRCSICCFAIHSDCAFLPRNLQIQKTTYDKFYHTHPLILSYSFLRTDQRDRYVPKCRVCGLWFWDDDLLWVYKCEKCWYYTHLNCATSRTEPFMSILSSSGLGKKTKNYIAAQHPNLLHLPFTDQNHSLQKHMFSREFGSESSTRTHELDLEHIHQHPLTLVDAQSTNSSSCHDPLKKIELLCNACVRPIMDVPYYMCSNEDQHCNFAIHEWCTRLPTKLENHPIHQQHKLVLLKNVSHEPFSVFKCAICKLDCNGFAYYCVQCNYYIDVTCGLIPKEITHDSHTNHLLKLLKSSQRCKACFNWIDYTHSFSCESCDYDLHIECSLLLPKTVRHRYDKKHAFNLSYFPAENHVAEYFCDICESDLDPTCCFYHCNDCDQSMHLACAPMMFHSETPFRENHQGNVNKYINIKFRGTCSIKDHTHPLSFVQGFESDGDCTRCKWALKYRLIFKCSQCKFGIHYDCCEVGRIFVVKS